MAPSLPRLLAVLLVLSVIVAAGCGGDDEEDVASAKDVEKCLKDEKLSVTRAPGGGVAGREDTITVILPESNIINIAFYKSEDDAKKGEEDAGIGVKAVDSGGKVERRGKVVTTVLRGGADDELKKVEDCL